MKFSRRDIFRMAPGAIVGAAALNSAACTTAEVSTVADATITPDPLLNDLPEITQEDYDKRIAKACELMGQNSIDGIVLTGATGLLYFSGISWWRSERLFAMVILASGDIEFVCPAFEEDRAREQAGDAPIRTWHEHEDPYALVRGVFADKGLSNATVGIEETVRFIFSERMRLAAPNFKFVSADPVSAGCRMHKDKKELELMRRANILTVKAYAIAANNLEAGMTEDDGRIVFRNAFTSLGLSGGGGPMHGANASFPHGTANRIPLTDGTIVLVDGGTSLNGYRADISRTFVFGEPTKRQEEVWNVVKEAQSAALAAAVAGKTLGGVDDAARAVVTAGGFGPDYKYFTHRLGHGIGMDGHEWPYLVRGNEMLLEPGMTFSNEPGIYIPSELGVRLEDIMYIDDDGQGKFFTEASKSIHEPF